MRLIARIFCFGVFAGFILMPHAQAAGLVSGHYRFETKLSPVCLHGVYPFTVGT